MIGKFDDQLAAIGRAFQGAATGVVEVVIVIEWGDGMDGNSVFGAVAILIWGPAAMKLIDRDEWIGWTQRQRAERLGLIVQNWRFLVLAETRIPNLASRAMGVALQQLPDHWQEKYGYRPLLVETLPTSKASI